MPLPQIHLLTSVNHKSVCQPTARCPTSKPTTLTQSSLTFPFAFPLPPIPPVTAYPITPAEPHIDNTIEDPMAYLNSYESSNTEESEWYLQPLRNKEEPFDNQWYTSSDMPEPEAKEDPYSHESDALKYPDMTEDPEMPEEECKEYDWPTTGMASLIAEEYWNPKKTGLEDNEHSSMLHDQMTLAEVSEWLQEPSDQVVFDRYDRPDREDNKKQQRLRRLELRRNHWTRDLSPDF